MASRELNIVIKATAKGVSAALKGVKSELKGLDKTLGKGLSNAWKNTEKGIVIGAGAAAAGLGYAVNQAINFEDAFAGVKKTVDATDLTKAGLSFQDLSDGIREMSRQMPIAADEIAAIEEQAGALGVKVADLQNFTKVAALLGVTTDVSSEDAATALGQLQNVIGLTGADYERFGSTLVDLGNKGASTESQILEMATRIGASAKLVGIGKAATLGWSSAVANLGIEAEAGGTAIQKFFLTTLQKVNSPGGLKTLAKTAGMTGKAFKQAYEKDASGALQTFLKGLGKLKQADQLKVLKSLGLTDQRLTRALLGLAGNTDNLTDSLHTANDAWKQNNALQNEADKRFETTKSQLQLLKNNLDDAAITIGQAVLPQLVELSKAAVGWIQGHQPEIKQFAKDIADGLRQAVTWASKLDWEAIGNTLKTVGGVGKTLLDAFLAMPSWVQVAVATGWGLNKFTGGAVGSIVGEIGKGLIKGVLGINAGVVNVKGAVVNGPGGGVGGGTPVGGGASTATKLLAAGGVVLGGVVIGAEVAKAANASTINPAKDFEQAGFQSTIADDNNIKSLQTKLDAIDANLRTTIFDKGFDPLKNATEFLQDPLKAIAVSLSGAPIVGDALGNLQPELEKQRDAIEKKINELKASQQTTDGILRHSASEHNAVVTQTNAKLAQLNQHASSNAAKTAAMLTASRETASKLANIPPHLSRIEGASAQTARYTGVTSRKNFSPHFTANVVTHISSQVRLSVNAMATKLTSQHISSQAGVTGGLIE